MGSVEAQAANVVQLGDEIDKGSGVGVDRDAVIASRIRADM